MSHSTPPDPDFRPGDEAPDDTAAAGEDICPDCSGSGRQDSGSECPTCSGTGKITEGVGGG